MISDAQPTPDSGPSKRPGQMTSVMRAAVRPAGPRQLRAALVRAGRVVDERLIPRGEPLTVGPSEHAMFVVNAAALRGSTKLIERVRDGYRLSRIEGMSGRVAADTGVVDLESLPPTATLLLGDTSRGKIAIGDSIILFHFVDPPVRPPRAQLPLAVKQGLFGDLDWKTTFIAAFSFLFHFGAIGAIYSDWADPVLDDEARVAQMIEILKEMPAPPPIDQHTSANDDAKSDKSADPAPAKAPSNAGRNVAPGPARGSAGRMSESRANQIADALRASDDAMILAIGARSDSATGRVLAAGNDVPLGNLNAVAANAAGARPGDFALNLRGDGGGTVQPGKGGRGGLPGADTSADARSNDVGKQVEVKKPVASARVDPPSVSGGRVADAARVIASLKGLFRACYKRALDEDPTMRGTVRLTAQIAPNGDVKSVSAAPSGLSSSMTSCVTRVMRGAQFSPPEGGGATLDVPMTFIPQ